MCGNVHSLVMPCTINSNYYSLDRGTCISTGPGLDRAQTMSNVAFSKVCTVGAINIKTQFYTMYETIIAPIGWYLMAIILDGSMVQTLHTNK